MLHTCHHIAKLYIATCDDSLQNFGIREKKDCTHYFKVCEPHTLQKHLGYFDHILGCLSYIGVTNKRYQIESSLRSLSLDTLASIFFRRPIWLNS